VKERDRLDIGRGMGEKERLRVNVLCVKVCEYERGGNMGWGSV